MRLRARLPIVAAACLLALAGAGTALAALSTTASASQTISTRNLGAASGLTGSASGHNLSLTWTAGMNGSGYAVAAAANGTSSDCSGATFSALTTTAGTSATDTGRFSPQGTFECYRVTTTYGTWSSQTGNPTVAVRIGVVAQAVTTTNGGTAGRLDAGDTIAITFNQAITTASGPVAGNNVCTNTGGTVMVGVTGTGTTCSTGSVTTVGTLTGLTINRAARYNATFAWSAANTVLTVTIGSRSAGSQDPATSDTALYTPTTTATGLLSQTGAFHTCSSNSGGGSCTPSASGSF
jgi:hypothetical protein